MRLPPRGTKELRAIFARYKRGVQVKGWFGRKKRINQTPIGGAMSVTTHVVRKSIADTQRIVKKLNHRRGVPYRVREKEFRELQDARFWRLVADRWANKVRYMRGSKLKLKALNHLSNARKNAGISRS